MSCELVSKIDDFTLIMGDIELRKLTNEKAADCFVHFEGRFECKNALVEIKGSHISEALRQLESTYKAIMKNGYKIDKAIIFIRKISKMERKMYEISGNYLYRKQGKKKYPVKIARRIIVEVYRV